MDERDKKKLRRHRLLLSVDLNVEEIKNALVQEQLFTPNELEKIERHKDPITSLLDQVEQKGPNAFNSFKASLQHIQKPHLVDIFNEDNYEEKANEEHSRKDPEIQIKKEFEDEPHCNVSGSTKNHPEGCSEEIEKLQRKLEKLNAELVEETSLRMKVQHENDKLNLKVIQTEKDLNDIQSENLLLRNLCSISADAKMSRCEHDYQIMISMSSKIHKITEENYSLHALLLKSIDTHKELRNKNTKPKNELDQINLTCKNNDESKYCQEGYENNENEKKN